MCESTAYLKRGDSEDLLLEDVASIRPEGDGLLLVSILGERKSLKARIEEINLMAHRIVLVET